GWRRTPGGSRAADIKTFCPRGAEMGRTSRVGLEGHDQLAVLVALDADHDRVAIRHAQVGLKGSLDVDGDQQPAVAYVERADADVLAGGKDHAADLLEAEVEGAHLDHVQALVAEIVPKPPVQ